MRALHLFILTSVNVNVTIKSFQKHLTYSGGGGGINILKENARVASIRLTKVSDIIQMPMAVHVSQKSKEIFL